MPEKPAGEKTEKPTPRRIAKAREKGQVARSQEAPAFMGILILVVVFIFIAPTMIQWGCDQITDGLKLNIDPFNDSDGFNVYFSKKISELLLISLPIMISLVISAIIGCALVSGFYLTPKALTIKWDAISPVKGAKNLVNGRSVVQLLLSIAKMVFISIIVYFYFKERTDQLNAFRWAWSTQLLTGIGNLLLGMMIRILIALLIIALVDGAYQKWKNFKELKMTKYELKKEFKDTDGSPELKARIRKIQMEAAQKRALQEVPKANVLLVNPTHYAVAMKYDPKTMDSPQVVAKGADHIAQKMREIATAYGVPIIRKPELARAIYSTVDVGRPIPEQLFAAVAEILAMVYRIKQNRLAGR